jgi:hypothetical protein
MRPAGLHTHDTGPDLTVLVAAALAAAVAVSVAEFIFSHIWELAAGTGVLLAAAVAGGVWWRRALRRGESAFAAAGAERRRAIAAERKTALPPPQVHIYLDRLPSEIAAIIDQRKQVE